MLLNFSAYFYVHFSRQTVAAKECSADGMIASRNFAYLDMYLPRKSVENLFYSLRDLQTSQLKECQLCSAVENILYYTIRNKIPQ